MSNNYTTNESEGGAANNGSSAISRREARANSITGALPALGTLGIERNVQSGTFDFEQMVQSLKELFANDRQIASQSDATRCGICYLHFHGNELHYREEGFYVCSNCEHNLGQQHLSMLRKQQKL
ncbi:hypothetical protein KDA_22990 [Dictyobacter alpinus]|uniref:Uncharacterized protein n=1 Tax=Dictyobacter alpinus TaxID=2014873 RepID=A0A402B649_9CHLR|nr:hypothetical protein [Dictyobacter alpinus]GCE26815.1 hypothetical protein KDA_22990 [Dictyobacter alpinus]